MASPVYWIGADGNIYYGSGQTGAGVINAGPAANANPTATGYTDPWAAGNGGTPVTISATQIADPLAKGSTTTNAITSNQANDIASIDATQKSLDQLPAILSAALANNQTGYNNADSSLGANEQVQRDQYGAGTEQNQKNYDANTMAALRSGATGLQGLLSILRGTGVEDWANNAVRDTVNGDIRTGLDTQSKNQSLLDNSLSSFLTDLAQKRQSNKDTLSGNNAAARKDNATQLQRLYGDMAKYYSDMGDTANATKYMGMAGNQASVIAANSVAPVSPFTTTPVAVRAPEISAFAGPTQQAINYSPTSPSNSQAIFSIGDARRRLAGVGA